MWDWLTDWMTSLCKFCTHSTYTLWIWNDCHEKRFCLLSVLCFSTLLCWFQFDDEVNHQQDLLFLSSLSPSILTYTLEKQHKKDIPFLELFSWCVVIRSVSCLNFPLYGETLSLFSLYLEKTKHVHVVVRLIEVRSMTWKGTQVHGQREYNVFALSHFAIQHNRRYKSVDQGAYCWLFPIRRMDSLLWWKEWLLILLPLSNPDSWNVHLTERLAFSPLLV